MTQPHKLLKINRHLSPLWLGGLCWLSSMAISEIPVFAQTSPAPVVPSAQELLQPVEPIAAPEPMPQEVAPLLAPEAAPQPIAPPKSVDLELSSPGADAESHPSPTGNAAPLVSPDLPTQAESAFGQKPGFIDSTPYSLGATDNPNVVLSERSTGCEATVQPGQGISGSVCSFSQEYATRGGGGNSGFAGEMSLGVVYGGGRTTPSGRDFYNLTIRPPARLTVGNVGLLFPLSIPAAITSAFGWRIHPVMGESRFHAGTDLGAPQGTPVMAAFSGKVAIADFMGGYGLSVVVQHGDGSEETLYAHLSEIFVKPGESVKQGEVIGRVGSTGLSTGPHLHFEFRKRTPEGWAVMDAGGALEFALSQFVDALKLGLSYPPQLASLKSTSFTKALEMAHTKSEKPSLSTIQSDASIVVPALLPAQD